MSTYGAFTPERARAAPSWPPPRRARAEEKALLKATLPFARASNARGRWQLGSTLALVVAALVILRVATPLARAPIALVLSLLLVRVFVLQHDCGHRSLFASTRENDLVGRVLAAITGVPHEGWRVEHNWHHQNQGRLARRGIDRMNSPMTAAEARANPAGAQLRDRKIRPWTIAVLGCISLLFLRKRVSGFFPFRPNFRWRIENERGIRRGVVESNVAHALVHAAIAVALGPLSWLAFVVPAYLLAGMVGASLFWVQHNFEEGYQAEDARWSHAEVALRGSSYLQLGPVLDWFTASIGLHHVHHLNPRIPNHRLEAARRAIPEVAAVPPLDVAGLWSAYRAVFWDDERRRMVTLAEVTDTDAARMPPDALPTGTEQT